MGTHPTPAEVMARRLRELDRQAGIDPVAWFVVALNSLDADSDLLYRHALSRLRRLGWDVLYRRPRGRAALDPRPIFARLVDARSRGDHAEVRRLGTQLRDTGWTAASIEPRPSPDERTTR